MKTATITEITELYPATSTRRSLTAATKDGWVLCHYNTPIEPARSGLTVEEAEAIAREDASLVYLTR